MIHFKIYKNYNARVIYINNISVDYFKQTELVKGVPWYVIDENQKLIGRIGLKEHREIVQKNKIVVNKNFIHITDNVNVEQKAREIFIEKSNIRKIPVITLDGTYLFEYEKQEENIEDFYKEYTGTCYAGKKRTERIVVSLTSYGERLSTVYIAINSILCQTMKPDEVVLYISEEDAEKEVANEEELIRSGVTIRRGVKNLKPHKKYFYAFQEYQDCLVVTIDDDNIYDDITIEELYTYHMKYADAVICRRGRRMTKINDELELYQNWENYIVSTEPEIAACAIGVGGILYPVGDYRKKFLDEYTILQIAEFEDDLWLKTIELLNNIKVYATGNMIEIPIKGSQKNALNRINVLQCKNDECIKAIQNFFDINFCDYI